MQPFHENGEAILGRLEVLENRLSQLEGFPYTKKLMNIESYLKNNYNQFIRLQNQFSKVRKQAQSKYKLPSSSQIDRLYKENNMLKFKNDQAQKQSFVPQIPLPQNQVIKLKQLETEAYDLSLKTNYLRRKNKAYNDAMKVGDMFAQQLQNHRKVSSELAQQFKYYIKQINLKTGKNQNPNTLLIHLK